MNNYNNIPKELKELGQWVVWSYVHRSRAKKPTKVLYNPNTRTTASTQNPATWVDFETALSASENYDGIGFVFTHDDEYAGIDLDVDEGEKPSNFQLDILKDFASYAEYSPSGRGVHIIVKGSIPEGVNRQGLGVEMYSQGRYFTFTGNKINDRPIIDQNKKLNELYYSIKKEAQSKLTNNRASIKEGSTEYNIQNPVNVNDEKLINNLFKSQKNKDYFNLTDHNVNWSEAYNSVLSALCLFSTNEQQILNIILNSPLVTDAGPHGSEDRADRVQRLWATEYNKAAQKADLERQDQPYKIWSTQWFPNQTKDFYTQCIEYIKETLNNIKEYNNKIILDEAKKHRRKPVKHKLPVPLATAKLFNNSDLDLDDLPGNFDRVIHEIMARTRNPSRTMAIWALLGFISGAVGRTYITEDGAGVNNFLILTAGTNTGKTQHWNALESIVRISAPKLLNKVFGGSAASPQILAEEAQNQPSMVFRLPDAGAWLMGVVNARSQMQLSIREALLNIYDSASLNASWHIPKSIRAKESKNQSVNEFNMSMVLDTTPQYLNDFELEDFTDGLMSRFILVYGPNTISHLQKPKSNMDIPSYVKSVFYDLQKVSASRSRPANTDDLGFNPPDRIVIEYNQGLSDYFWKLETEMVDIIRDIQTKQLPDHYIAASRTVLNAKRIASVIAIIQNPAKPIMTKEMVDWALKFVMISVTNVIKNFDTGEMGSSESKQEACIIDFISRKIQTNSKENYVTLTELSRYVDRLSPFSKSKLGARFTRQKAIEDLVNRGVLVEIEVPTRTKPTKALTLG